MSIFVSQAADMNYSEISKLLSALFVVVSATALGGCATEGQLRQREYERQRQETLERQRIEQQGQQILGLIRSRCQQFGFQPNTDGFAGCVQQEVQSLTSRFNAQQQQDRLIASCRSAMAVRPSSGGFGESLNNVAKCDSDPRANLREEDKGYTCTRSVTGAVTCKPD